VTYKINNQYFVADRPRQSLSMTLTASYQRLVSERVLSAICVTGLSLALILLSQRDRSCSALGNLAISYSYWWLPAKRRGIYFRSCLSQWWRYTLHILVRPRGWWNARSARQHTFSDWSRSLQKTVEVTLFSSGF